MPKRPNPMAVKQVLTYTVEEAAHALNVTTATIRSYIRRGLPIMADQRPTIMSGYEIRKFLREERTASKSPLAQNELRCPTCRVGRKPLGMLVDLEPINDGTAILKGLCEKCEAPCSRFIATSKLPEFAQTFDVTERAGRTA